MDSVERDVMACTCIARLGCSSHITIDEWLADEVCSIIAYYSYILSVKRLEALMKANMRSHNGSELSAWALDAGLMCHESSLLIASRLLAVRIFTFHP